MSDVLGGWERVWIINAEKITVFCKMVHRELQLQQIVEYKIPMSCMVLYISFVIYLKCNRKQQLYS